MQIIHINNNKKYKFVQGQNNQTQLKSQQKLDISSYVLLLTIISHIKLT